MGQDNPTGYSADVKIWLLVGSLMVPLSHASSTYVIAKHAIDLPAGDASIVFTIDDVRYERPVSLINGMSRHSREAMVLGNDADLPF